MLLMALAVFLRLAPRQVQEAGEAAPGTLARCC
jgi:hypothetical protein